MPLSVPFWRKQSVIRMEYGKLGFVLYCSGISSSVYTFFLDLLTFFGFGFGLPSSPIIISGSFLVFDVFFAFWASSAWALFSRARTLPISFSISSSRLSLSGSNTMLSTAGSFVNRTSSLCISFLNSSKFATKLSKFSI